MRPRPPPRSPRLFLTAPAARPPPPGPSPSGAASRSRVRMRRRCSASCARLRLTRARSQSLACSQATRQAWTCCGYRPRWRQYSPSSAALSAAVSTTVANLSAVLQPSGPASASGNSRPRARAWRRQLNSVASLMPSSAASSFSARLFGGSILRSTASFRSSEYLGTSTSCTPPATVRVSEDRGDNYSDTGGPAASGSVTRQSSLGPPRIHGLLGERRGWKTMLTTDRVAAISR